MGGQLLKCILKETWPDVNSEIIQWWALVNNCNETSDEEFLDYQKNCQLLKDSATCSWLVSC
jgi:hypothetical protein